MSWIKITTSTFSSSSSHSVDNCFSNTYRDYMITFLMLGSTDNERVDMRMRASGTDTTSSIYDWVRFDGATTSVNYGGSTSDSRWDRGATNERSTQYQGGVTRILNPYQAVHTTGLNEMWFGGTTSQAISVRAFRLPDTTIYDGFTIFPFSGTLTGSLTVYGATLPT